MTCIAAIEHGGGVTMGGDSAAVGSYELNVRRDPKVFHVGPFLIGYTSSFRMGQVLRFRLEAPEHAAEIDDFEYMATAFIDSVRECLKTAGFMKKENEVETGGSFLVAYRGRLYEVDDDFQVGQNLDGYAAVGCGARIALGALAVTEGELPGPRIEKALRAAERWNAGVRGPFAVELQRRESVERPEPPRAPFNLVNHMGRTNEEREVVAN